MAHAHPYSGAYADQRRVAADRAATAMSAGLGVPAYPSMRQAAKLIGVSASTLSRRTDVELVRAGQEERVPAAEVLRLAALYHRRSLSRVAAELVERAQSFPADIAQAVSNEVDGAIERLQTPPSIDQVDVARFLAAAEQLLPADMVADVRAALEAEGDQGHEDIGDGLGWAPTED